MRLGRRPTLAAKNFPQGEVNHCQRKILRSEYGGGWILFGTCWDSEPKLNWDSKNHHYLNPLVLPKFVLGKGYTPISDGLPGFPVPTCLPVAYSKESLQGRICCWQSASGMVTRDAIAHRHQGEKEGELEILGTLILISSCYLIVNSKMLNNIEIYNIDMDTLFCVWA